MFHSETGAPSSARRLAADTAAYSSAVGRTDARTRRAAPVHAASGPPARWRRRRSSPGWAPGPPRAANGRSPPGPRQPGGSGGTRRSPRDPRTPRPEEFSRLASRHSERSLLSASTLRTRTPRQSVTGPSRRRSLSLSRRPPMSVPSPRDPAVAAILRSRQGHGTLLVTDPGLQQTQKQPLNSHFVESGRRESNSRSQRS